MYEREEFLARSYETQRNVMSHIQPAENNNRKPRVAVEDSTVRFVGIQWMILYKVLEKEGERTRVAFNKTSIPENYRISRRDAMVV